MGERLQRRSREDMPEFEHVFATLEQDQGYVSRSLFMLGRDAGLLTAVGLMHEAAWYAPTLDPAVRDFAAYAFTMYRRAPYSAAHCALNAERHGIPRVKVVSIFAPDSDIYDARERTLLSFCAAAATTPGSVDGAAFAALSVHFDQPALLTLTALMAMMSFLTTWNAIMGTALEETPLSYAREVLAPIGWDVGVHALDVRREGHQA
ncbi:hypothetical protein AncyloWKF20_18555 [Ancylobacter sp. WKF20]|uniref:carboxymuconolactone decarboxylase family protein n=1 Tax=Ancylobacter sp. WKF20 TaxID=3039801 RepID=UPI002434531C|nr:hypothetical protein [Ancylobacter sp. WKF20]WGD29738.1 hypothetical protein AncyloWKF20_18555 [Ancylobacter sp. WKF20]